MHPRLLTVSLRSVLQAEGERKCGVVFEEFGRKRVPPEVVAVLKHRGTRLARPRGSRASPAAVVFRCLLIVALTYPRESGAIRAASEEGLDRAPRISEVRMKRRGENEEVEV